MRTSTIIQQNKTAIQTYHTL